jgi:hypothetical protein
MQWAEQAARLPSHITMLSICQPPTNNSPPPQLGSQSSQGAATSLLYGECVVGAHAQDKTRYAATVAGPK